MIRFELYESQHVEAVSAFNRRMGDSGMDAGFLLPDAPRQFDPSLPLSTQCWLAIDGDDVRGGYLLEWRDFWIRGRQTRVCDFQTPLSEGVIDRKYSALGVQLVRHALKLNPLMYTVGMGGLGRPLPRMLGAMRFHLTTVPFLFRINNPARFLAEIQYLRMSPLRRLALDIARFSGLGWAGLTAVRTAPFFRRDRTVRFREAATLDPIADTAWEDSRDRYALLAVRDSRMMSLRFQAHDKGIRRIAIYRGERAAGWAAVVRVGMRGNRYFGNMNVGVIADCLAAPADAAAVIQAAGDCLARADVDIVVANFQHPAWIAGCRRSGFFPAPSNHGLALSPALVELLQPFDENLRTQVHLTRSDGDGMANLPSQA
jgi:hypothetical protein